MNYWAISKHINIIISTLVWNSFSLLYKIIYDIVTYSQQAAYPELILFWYYTL